MIRVYCMTQRGYGALAALLEAGHAPRISEVVTARDVGLREDYHASIVELCESYDVPHSGRGAARVSPVPTYSIAIAWRWLLGPEAGTVIVLHDSLLPAYRGFAPVVAALIAGERELGVTALIAGETYDTGPVLAQASTPITPPLRIAEAYDLLEPIYAEIATDVFARLSSGEALQAVDQGHGSATYSLWRDGEDYRIDWADSSERIQRVVFALGSPFAGARARLNGEEVIIEDVVPVPDVQVVERHVGKVIWLEDGLPVVVCGEGLLKVITCTDSASAVSCLPLTRFRSRFS